MKIRKKDLNLIRKVAWSFHNTTGIEFNELYSQACLAYCEALHSFNPEKEAKKITWAWIRMKQDLTNFIKYEQKHKVPGLDIAEFPEELFGVIHQNHKTFNDLLMDLPKECRFIAATVQKNQEVFENLKDPLLKLKSDLREIGWSYPRIEQGVRSTKLALKTL